MGILNSFSENKSFVDNANVNYTAADHVRYAVNCLSKRLKIKSFQNLAEDLRTKLNDGSISTDDADKTISQYRICMADALNKKANIRLETYKSFSFNGYVSELSFKLHNSVCLPLWCRL